MHVFLVFKIFDNAENSSVEIPDYIYKFILSREQDFKRHSLTVLLNAYSGYGAIFKSYSD
jgi:hypothetical protein